jgi:NADH dehydrogenase
MEQRIVTVFGGSGFIGRYVVRALAAAGDAVRVAVRHPDTAHFLRPMGDVGQVAIMQANLRDDASVARAVAGAAAVVNAAGAYVETGAQTYAAIHVEGYGRVARAARGAGIERLVHVSGIGADPGSRFAYVRSKGDGEAEVRREFPAATILRPSAVFGPEDALFNQLAAVARLAPVLPIFGHTLADAGTTRVQPVYVGDVAQAVVKALADRAACGTIYELGGPKAYTYRELWQLVLAVTGRRRLMLPIPFALARIQAALFELLPNPPLTRDQLTLLETDNLPAPGARGFADLGIAPTPAEAVIPRYLDRYRQRYRIGVAA